MELSAKNVCTKQLGHLGLVAATIKDLGLINKIDARLALDKSKGGIISHGKRVAAMVLNGLGFINSRLYMSQMFFHDKPISAMLGDEVLVEHLNDDCLGRCLDEISRYGTTKLFSEVAFEIAKEQGLLSRSLHLDTTSLTLYGEYSQAIEEGSGPMPCLGYSKDNRHDLKQVVLSMVQMGPAHLPVWMEDLPGNSSDKASFHETVRKMHAGFICTVHANTPKLALSTAIPQNIIMSGIEVPNIKETLYELIDVVLQLHKTEEGNRVVTDILFPKIKESIELKKNEFVL